MDRNQPISTIMTTEVECVSPDQKILDVKHIYEKRNFHRHIPVVEGGKLIGMVSLVDFMRKIQNATLDDAEPVYNEVNVEEIMSRAPAFIALDTPIETVAKELATGAVHAYVVVDDGEVKGIVSTADIIRFFLDN